MICYRYNQKGNSVIHQLLSITYCQLSIVVQNYYCNTEVIKNLLTRGQLVGSSDS